MATRYIYRGRARFHCVDCDTCYRKTDYYYDGDAPATVSVDENDYAIFKKGRCPACTRVRNKKILRGILIGLVIAAVIIAISLAVTKFGNFLTGNGGMADTIFEKAMDKYEAYADNIEMPAGSTTLRDAFLQDIAREDEYTMYIYGEQTSVVQKDTEGRGADWYFDLKDGFGELSGKQYLLDQRGQVIYLLGKENVAYYASSAEYAVLYAELSALFAENYCAVSPFEKEVSCRDMDRDEISLLYGDGVRALVYDDGYFEKHDDYLVRIMDEETKALPSIPKNCREVR